MQHTRFNLLFNRVKRRFFARTYIARFVFLSLGILFLGVIFFGLANISDKLSKYLSQTIFQTSGRTNILILGIGGKDHDGPDLTDSIIVLSINRQNYQPLLLSIPRDIWVPTIKAKINSIYHYGEQKQTNGGLILAKSSISQIIDQPIHYAVVVDFSTFEKAIDILGGIDLSVDVGFTDSQYPIAGKENDACDNDILTKCRYEQITFVAGPQHMTGSTALKFVRSRHAAGDEGTDFARGKRQEKVITAIKNKLLSPDIYSHPEIYYRLYTLVKSSVKTDISSNLYLQIIGLGLKTKSQPIATYALTIPDQLTHPAISSTYLNQWVLIPKDNNPENITKFVQNIFTSPHTP